MYENKQNLRERIAENQSLMKTYETLLHERALSIEKLQQEYNSILQRKANLLKQIISDTHDMHA
jgi:hypothetical protein